MKFPFLLPALLLFSVFTFAQSADLDKEFFHISYVNLPTNPILDAEKRTYNSRSGDVNISGFSNVQEGASLDLDFDFKGTIVEGVDVKTFTHEKKDKEGKVTSTTYTYRAIASYSSTAYLRIKNNLTGVSDSKRYSKNEKYESKAFSKYSDASKFFQNNKYDLKNKYRDSHKRSFRSKAIGRLNSTYGYVVENGEYEKFWILGSKKHPEFAKHHEAYDKLKVIFAKMKYNEPLDEIKKEVQPLIEYFESVVLKYQGKKRKLRKVRYASYYNIAKIYNYLDNPEKSKEYGQKIIDNDYSKKDGRAFIRIADDLISKFKVNETRTRHFEIKKI